MRPARIAVLAVTAVLCFAVMATAEEKKPEAWGGVVSGKATMTVVVEKVDPATREVTVKNDKGQTETVVCGPMVRNFDQIKVGDKITVQYEEAVSIIALSGVEGTPMRSEGTDVATAPLGQKPAGTIVKTQEVLADVTALDLKERTVTLKGPLQEVTVKVDPEVKGFEKLKVGDKVHLRYTRTLAIEVTAQ